MIDENPSICKEDTITEFGSLSHFSVAKGQKWGEKNEDGESILSGGYSETSTLVMSTRTRASSIFKSKAYSESRNTIIVPTIQREGASGLTLEKLRFRVRYALNCVLYPPSNRNGHRPPAIAFRVEKNWWLLENDVWTHMEQDPSEHGDVAKECAKLVECIRLGNRPTQERALDAISHLSIKYGDILQPIFHRADATGIIKSILSSRAEGSTSKWKCNAVSASDTLTFRCRRTLQALQYTDGCELFGLHVCVTNMEEGDAEAREATKAIVQRIQDLDYSFIATRIISATIYNKPGLIPEGIFDILYQLLDHIHRLHDPLGMDDLYGWALKNYKCLAGTKEQWPYTAKSLESTGMVSLKRLVRTLFSKEHVSYLKVNMPNTYQIVSTLHQELS